MGESLCMANSGCSSQHFQQYGYQHVSSVGTSMLADVTFRADWAQVQSDDSRIGFKSALKFSLPSFLLDLSSFWQCWDRPRCCSTQCCARSPHPPAERWAGSPSAGCHTGRAEASVTPCRGSQSLQEGGSISDRSHCSHVSCVYLFWSCKYC